MSNANRHPDDVIGDIFVLAICIRAVYLRMVVSGVQGADTPAMIDDLERVKDLALIGEWLEGLEDVMQGMVISLKRTKMETSDE